MLDLVLITYDFPYGVGETFLETEIEYAAKYFNTVYILSLSRNTRLTRTLPTNVRAFKVTRHYHLISCLLYTLDKLFSKEARCEYRDIRHLRNKPNIWETIKAWIITWMIEKRLSIAVDNLHLKPNSSVGYSYWLSQSAYFLSKSNQFKYRCSRAHGYEVRDYETYIPFRAYTDAHLDEIFFISEYTRDEYNRILLPLLFSAKRSPQAIYRLGVNRHVNCNRSRNMKNGTLHIVSCSTINALKRLDLLIQALALIDVNKKIDWVHIGWGEKANEMIALSNNLLAKKNNIKYRFLRSISNQKIMEYYRNNNVDIFINVSDNEGIPVSIMEAMSFGIPCIGRAVGGNPEIIHDGVSGYLLKKDAESSEIAELIERYMDDVSYRIGSDSVLSFFEQNYEASHNYERFYEHVVNESSVE